MQINTIVYVGDSRSRQVLREFEFEPTVETGPGRKQFEVRGKPLSLSLLSSEIHRAVFLNGAV